MGKKAIGIRTVFMGTSAFAETILKGLIGSDYNIISVYTQPDKKVGRDQTVKKSAVRIAAETAKIPVFTPEHFDDEEITDLARQKPDILIVVAYGKILPKKVLDMPGFGAINIHASLLPEYRGPSPIQNAILDGKKKTGTTVMLMDEGIDTGPIISQREIKVNPEDTSYTLSIKLADLSSELLLETLPTWIEKKKEAVPQDESKATLCQLIERSDGRVLWSDDAQTIYDQYRAFLPWPGIFAYWQKGNENIRIKLNKIELLKDKPEKEYHQGEVFVLGDKFGVQTNLGAIILEEVQMEGKTNLPIKTFINGNKDFVGSILK